MWSSSSRRFWDSLPFLGPGGFMFCHGWCTAAAAKWLQSCPTLCDPIDGSPPGSPIPGILHARTLEWVAVSFSNAWKWKGEVKSLSHVWLLATPWTAAYPAPPSMGFSRQEDWSGVPLPSPMVDVQCHINHPYWITLFGCKWQKTQLKFIYTKINRNRISAQTV